LAFHQQAADQLGGNELGGAGEEGVGEVLGGRGGYGSGLGSGKYPSNVTIVKLKL